MKTISIISTSGEIHIEADLTDEQHDSGAFTICTNDYMIEVTNTDEMVVSNAMDGYGRNCKSDFKDALIEVFV